MNAVVGAGLSGLVAAKYLVESDMNTVVFEKDKSAGGRVKTNKFNVDIGAQFVTELHFDTLDLIKKFNLKLTRIVEPSAVIYKDNRFFRIDNESLSDTERDFIYHIIKIAKSNGISFISCNPDEISFSDWVLSEWNDTLLEEFAQPWISALTLTDPENISAMYGILLIFSELTGVYTIGGGMGRLSDVLCEYIKNRGCKISLEEHIKHIEIESSPTLVSEDGNTYSVDRAILAVPAPVAAEILKVEAPVLAQKLAKFDYSTAYQIIIGLDSHIWDNSWSILIPRLEMEGIAAICSPHIKRKDYDGNSVLEFFLYGDGVAKFQKIGYDYIYEIIDTLFPEVKYNITYHEMIYWEHALPIYNINNTEKLNDAILDIPEDVFLAGDYLFAPSIEAAVVSGKLAGVSVCETQHISWTGIQDD